jgi:hypothetical protein
MLQGKITAIKILHLTLVISKKQFENNEPNKGHIDVMATEHIFSKNRLSHLIVGYAP